MKDVEISPSPAHQLSNVAFAQFVSDHIVKIKNVDVSKGSDPELNVFVTDMENQNENYRKSIAKRMANANTALITDYDGKRGWSYKVFHNGVKLQLQSPVEENRQAALAIMNLIKPFGKISRLSLEEETQAIDSLIERLESAEVMPFVQRLAFETYLENLKQDNINFKTHYYNRLAQKVSSEPADNRDQRGKIMVIYKNLCDYALIMARMEKGELYDEVVKIADTIRTSYQTQLGRMAPRISDEPVEE